MKKKDTKENSVKRWEEEKIKGSECTNQRVWAGSTKDHEMKKKRERGNKSQI